jgi:hypothetical protein
MPCVAGPNSASPGQKLTRSRHEQQPQVFARLREYPPFCTYSDEDPHKGVGSTD